MTRRDVYLVSLPVLAQLAAGHDQRPANNRQLVYVRIENASGVGWGECSALNRPTFTPEWAEDAFRMLSQGRPLTPQLALSHPMAAAALAMARLDRDLRAASTSLSARFGAGGASVRAGAAIGLGSPAEAADEAEALAAAGFERIKLKVVPNGAVERVAAIRRRLPSLEIQVDANGTFHPNEIDRLLALGEFGVEVVEQPFAPDEMDAPASLVEAGFVVVADEAATSLAAVTALRDAGALSAVAVKPAGVGGITKAWRLADECAALGLEVSAGGFLESGLGRHALAVFGAHPACTITGDLSPARRWLAADPWPDLVMDGASIVLSDDIGVAGDPDLAVLDAFTVTRTSCEATD